MYISHFWRKFYLYGEKTCIEARGATIKTKNTNSYINIFCLLFSFLLLFLVSFDAQAQRRSRGSYSPTNLIDYDEQTWHYGFIIGLNFTRFNITNSADYANNPNLMMNAKVTTGFALGLLANYRINDYVDLRFAPMATFNERTIEYTNLTTKEITLKTVESTILDLPLQAKFKSQRRGDSRVYLVAGVKPSFAISTRRAEQQDIVRVSTSDIALEIGAGFEKFFPMFKFSPELRFSTGLNNVFVPDKNPYTTPISKLYNYSVSLYLFFE